MYICSSICIYNKNVKIEKIIYVIILYYFFMEQEQEPVLENNSDAENNITMTIEELPVESSPDVVVETIQEPIIEPTVESSPESVVETIEETPIESSPEPAIEIIQEPIVETIQEPVVETIEETPIESSPEPIVEIIQEPIVETIQEPVVETIEETPIESSPEPVVETIQEPAIEIIQEPIVESSPEPAIEFIQESKIEKIPKLVFIVPYRDREEQKKFFQKHMKTILEDMEESDYKIFFIHQNDKRIFNRGAIKNIGFLYIRNLYPNDYKNITLVFNDVDIMPLNKNFINYETKKGIIKHFYGFTFTLGGIVSIIGEDFESINGFPNFWAWGYEDNALQHRAIKKGIHIDRSRFYPIMDKNFIILHDGTSRIVNKTEFDRYLKSTSEGINSINRLSFTIDENDISMININTFETGTSSQIESSNKIHNLKDGAKPFGNFVPRRGRGATMSMHI